MQVREITTRRYRSKQPRPIRGPDDVVALPSIRRLKKAKREHFLVLLLNARHEVEGVETVSVGSLNASIVHPREVFLPAVTNSAASIVLCHNHPQATPSHQKRTSPSHAVLFRRERSSASASWTTSSSRSEVWSRSVRGN